MTMHGKSRRDTTRRMWKAMIGKTRPDPVTDPREAIERVYGTNRAGNPNIRAAAVELGVSESTLRRWTHPDPGQRAVPAGDNAKALKRVNARATRRRNADPAWRAQQIAPAIDRAGRHGITLSVAGLMRISSERRFRSTGTMQIPPEDARQLYQAWATGDPATIDAALERAVTDHYFYNAVPAALLEIDELDLGSR